MRKLNPKCQCMSQTFLWLVQCTINHLEWNPNLHRFLSFTIKKTILYKFSTPCPYSWVLTVHSLITSWLSLVQDHVRYNLRMTSILTIICNTICGSSAGLYRPTEIHVILAFCIFQVQDHWLAVDLWFWFFVILCNIQMFYDSLKWMISLFQWLKDIVHIIN